MRFRSFSPFQNPFFFLSPQLFSPPPLNSIRIPNQPLPFRSRRVSVSPLNRHRPSPLPLIGPPVFFLLIFFPPYFSFFSGPARPPATSLSEKLSLLLQSCQILDILFFDLYHPLDTKVPHVLSITFSLLLRLLPNQHLDREGIESVRSYKDFFPLLFLPKL